MAGFTRSRRWAYIEPASQGDHRPIEYILSEDEILRQYYPIWRDSMIAIGKVDQISEENCIEDWVVTHWAYPFIDPLADALEGRFQ